MRHCGFKDIVLTVDADDELVGRNVLQVFNWGYRNKKAGVLYSNFYYLNDHNKIADGFTR